MGTDKDQAEMMPKRPQLWLRIVLMVILVAFVCFAFWMTYRPIIERLNQ